MKQAKSINLTAFLDYTNLNETATPHDIEQLCAQSITPHGPVAALCVYPQYVKQVYQLRDPRIRIASVANFPSGDQAIDTTLAEIDHALQDGADEIDVVMPYNAYLAGNDRAVSDYLTACRNACPAPVILKVILETGALKTPTHIQAATQLAIAAGADFIKTSTGKHHPGATPAAAEAILSYLKHHPHIGFKASGGLRTPEDALLYIQLAQHHLGNAYLHPDHLRLGTSRLFL